MLAALTLLLSFVLRFHTLTLTVHPSDGAALVTVEVGNDDYYRASSFYTDGANCRNHNCSVSIRDIPSGHYSLWVNEADHNGEITHIDKREFYIP